MTTISIIARFTIKEMARSNWIWMIGSCVMLGVGAAIFAGSLALVERPDVMVSVLAPMMRLLAVLSIALLTVAAVVRDFSERTITLVLAAPVSRSSWIIGKALGFTAVGCASALLCSIPLWFFSSASASAIWTVSLALELTLVSSGAMLIACVLRQVPASLLCVIVVYIMSRALGTLMLLSQQAPLAEKLGNGALESSYFGLLQSILPRLDLFTRTNWLIDQSFTLSLQNLTNGLGFVVAQSVLYAILLWSVAVIDFGAKDV